MNAAARALVPPAASNVSASADALQQAAALSATIGISRRIAAASATNSSAISALLQTKPPGALSVPRAKLAPLPPFPPQPTMPPPPPPSPPPPSTPLLLRTISPPPPGGVDGIPGPEVPALPDPPDRRQSTPKLDSNANGAPDSGRVVVPVATMHCDDGILVFGELCIPLSWARDAFRHGTAFWHMLLGLLAVCLLLSICLCCRRTLVAFCMSCWFGKRLRGYGGYGGKKPQMMRDPHPEENYIIRGGVGPPGTPHGCTGPPGATNRPPASTGAGAVNVVATCASSPSGGNGGPYEPPPSHAAGKGSAACGSAPSEEPASKEDYSKYSYYSSYDPSCLRRESNRRSLHAFYLQLRRVPCALDLLSQTRTHTAITRTATATRTIRTATNRACSCRTQALAAPDPSAHACIPHQTHVNPHPVRGIAAARGQAPASLEAGMKLRKKHRRHARRSQRTPQRSLSSSVTFLQAVKAPQRSHRRHRLRLVRSSRRRKRRLVRSHHTRGTARLVAARAMRAHRSTPTTPTAILITTRTRVARERIERSDTVACRWTGLALGTRQFAFTRTFQPRFKFDVGGPSISLVRKMRDFPRPKGKARTQARVTCKVVGRSAKVLSWVTV